MTYYAAMGNEQTNLPLTADQKLRLRNLQNKLLQLELQSAAIEKQIQEELRNITRSNGVDSSVYLNEDLDLVPVPTSAPPER